MTATDFTTAAWDHWDSEDRTSTTPSMAFAEGANWARDHLARQEPTGDEHYAAAQVIYEATTEDDILRWPHVSDEETARCMNLARAALTAAKEATR